MSILDILIRNLTRQKYNNSYIPSVSSQPDSKPHYLQEYEALLQRPEWKAKKKRIIKRDGCCCSRCGCTDRPLQVHHKYYLNYPDDTKVFPWQYPDDALITLCPDCHKKAHSNHKPKVYHISYKDAMKYM